MLIQHAVIVGVVRAEGRGEEFSAVAADGALDGHFVDEVHLLFFNYRIYWILINVVFYSKIVKKN